MSPALQISHAPPLVAAPHDFPRLPLACLAGVAALAGVGAAFFAGFCGGTALRLAFVAFFELICLEQRKANAYTHTVW